MYLGFECVLQKSARRRATQVDFQHKPMMHTCTHKHHAGLPLNHYDFRNARRTQQAASPTPTCHVCAPSPRPSCKQPTQNHCVCVLCVVCCVCCVLCVCCVCVCVCLCVGYNCGMQLELCVQCRRVKQDYITQKKKKTSKK